VIKAQVGDVFNINLPASSLQTALKAWKKQPPTSPAISVESAGGQGDRNVFWTNFRIKAVAPGKARAEFVGTEDPIRNVTFTFEVIPTESQSKKYVLVR